MWFLRCILPLFVARAVISHPQDHETVLERDVVIIGGGSSGTYAAVRLMDEGKSVVVLEKQDHLGGHMVTYTDPDTKQPFNLGVIIFHNTTIVNNYFGRFGVALRNVGNLDDGRAQAYVDFNTGRVVKGYKPVGQAALGAAIQKYTQIFLQKYPYLTLGYDLPDPVPKELSAPYSEFVKANGLQDLVQTVNNIGSCNGNLLDRPTLYGLKVFSPMLVQAFSTGFINAASGNNRDLYTGAQKLLQQKQAVVYNTNIKKVVRSSNGVSVWADTPKGKILVKAKKLVIAIPPVDQYLQGIGLDMTPEESNLFCKFKGFLYGSAVFTHRGFNSSTDFTNVGTNTPFNLLTLPGSYTYNPLAAQKPTNKIATYYGGIDSSLSQNAILQFIKGQLNNLEKAGSIGRGEPDFKYFGNHSPYHIHVSPQDIAEGFYKKLYALEGTRNTYWTGAAFVDNDSSMIWTWTEAYLLPLILGALKH